MPAITINRSGSRKNSQSSGPLTNPDAMSSTATVSGVAWLVGQPYASYIHQITASVTAARVSGR